MSATDIVLAAAGTGGGDKLYVDDVFSTYLYTGNASTQTITNGIDLAGEGGLVWAKCRSNIAGNALFDTVRGGSSLIGSDSTAAAYTGSTYINPFNSDGFTWAIGDNQVNQSGRTYCSWTFRKAPKFFDVVTYTGTGSARTIAHNLGSTPGMIFVKRTDSTGDWQVYHRSVAASQYLVLNGFAAPQSGTDRWNSTAPTDSVFSLGTNATVNASGGTYVAYIFAHNAGGFGEIGEDNVISCGTFTTDGSSDATVNLGYEPQFVLIKDLEGNQYWQMFDNMRGLNVDKAKSALLYPSTSNAESISTICSINATGFTAGQYPSTPYIYMAIRRPMKPPTSGTEVFSPIASPSEAAGTVKTTGFVTDMQMVAYRSITLDHFFTMDRLRSVNSLPTTYPSSSAGSLVTCTTAAEDGATNRTLGFNNTEFRIPAAFSSNSTIYYNFRRATGFFDVVCYTTTSSTNQRVSHNLGVVPELIIEKGRSPTGDWLVYTADGGTGKFIRVNSTGAYISVAGFWGSSAPTSTDYGTNNDNRYGAGATTVAYLFASVAGVSKVFSFTGNGSSQTINCGFAGGARFVMIKRTDSTGDWFVWDTARGIASGNDPHLSLNTTAAEVTTDDSIDPDSSGFVVNQLAATNINVSSATYIGIAIS